MKKILVLWMLLCIFALGANAQLLWKVSGKGLNKASYVLGTHHLAPLSILDSISGLKQAMNDVEQVCGEVVMEEMKAPATLMKMQQAAILPGDTTLHTLFTAAQYDSLAAKVKELMGVDLNMFDKMKPALLSTQLGVLIAMKSVPGFNPQQQLDEWCQAEAKKLGKAVTCLETVDFQMGVLFDSQSLKRQAEQLLATVNNLDCVEKQTNEVTVAYMTQDLDKLERAMNEKFGNALDALPEEEDALVYNRNTRWAENMLGIMSGKPTLFVVGCGHLVGDKGVLNLLKKQGYTVEAVK